jgi:Domain of unknown function (DUF1917)
VSDISAGEDELKSEYETRSREFDPGQFWTLQHRSIQWIAEQNREEAEARAARSRYHQKKLNDTQKTKHENGVISSDDKHATTVMDDDMMDIDPQPRQETDFFNPYEGDEMAKQLNEPLGDFLNRLKPSATPLSSGPWIWIANPRSQREGRSDIAGLKQEGRRLLGNFAGQRRGLEARYPEKPPGTITRMMKPAKDLLEEDIVKLARTKNLMNGKWMLFPSPSHVDEVWAKVARATQAGELGKAAKVATAADDDRSEKTRLICAYTEDFSNKADVMRVLKKLKELGLVRDEQGIFYKCDAYTYLDIMNGNEYRLKASMYGSKEMLKDV